MSVSSTHGNTILHFGHSRFTPTIDPLDFLKSLFFKRHQTYLVTTFVDINSQNEKSRLASAPAVRSTLGVVATRRSSGRGYGEPVQPDMGLRKSKSIWLIGKGFQSRRYVTTRRS